MGCTESKTSPYEGTSENADAQTKVSDKISAKDKAEKKSGPVPQRLLLLGAGESGKTTLIRQLIKAYGTGFTEEQRMGYRSVIVSNIFASIKAVFKLTNVSDEDRAAIEAAEELNEGIAELIKAIWNSPGVKEAAALLDLGLTHTAPYFLDRVAKIGKAAYLPSDQDIINCRVMTTAMAEYQLTVEGVPFTLCDMGGQRSYRGDWSSFESVTCLLFVASLGGYDENIREDVETNRMREALGTFEEVANAACFSHASLALILNKDDVLRRKLPHSALREHFPDYFGDNSHSDAREFIRHKFLGFDPRPPNQSHASFTVAVDSASANRAFNGIKDMLFKRNQYTAAALKAAAKMAAAVPPDRPPLEAVPVLDYWFCYEDFPVGAALARWTAVGPEADAAIGTKFGALMERAAVGDLEDWMASEGGSVALLLLLLEFPRRVYRGSRRMYEHHTRDVFRKFLRAMAPMRPRRFADMAVAHQLWLSQMLSYSEDFSDVRKARSAFNHMAGHPMWCMDVDGSEHAYLNGLEADINQRMMLFNMLCRFPHRNLQHSREFNETEKAYYIAEQPAGSLRPFEQQWGVLRDPQAIAAIRYVPPYTLASPPPPDIMLNYWYGENLTYERVPLDAKVELWLKGNQYKDMYVKEHFTFLYELRAQGALEFWKDTPSGTVAYLLVATQFSRTLFKNTARMYENDDLVSPMVNAMYYAENRDVGGTVFESLKIAHQLWAMLLLAYSEDVKDYTLVMDFLDFIVNRTYWNVLPIEKGFFALAKVMLTWKQEILQEFGRFPYKNFMLGRPMTEAETEHYRVGVRDGTLKEFEKVLPEHYEACEAQVFDPAAEQKRVDAGEDPEGGISTRIAADIAARQKQQQQQQQRSRQASRQASLQPSQQASPQPSRQASPQASRQASLQLSRRSSRQPSASSVNSG